MKIGRIFIIVFAFGVALWCAYMGNINSNAIAKAVMYVCSMANVSTAFHWVYNG